MFFHWDYLNETVKQRFPRRADQIGVFIVEIRDPARAAEVSAAIDATFRNSLAETLTETEKAFQLGFIAMTETILLAIQAVSFVVHRHHHGGDGQHDGDDRARAPCRVRDAEGARLPRCVRRRCSSSPSRSRSHSPAASLGIALTVPVAAAFAGAVGTLFPVFIVSEEHDAGPARRGARRRRVAAIAPAWHAARVPIVEGLRAVG